MMNQGSKAAVHARANCVCARDGFTGFIDWICPACALTDDELHEVFRSVLADDPDCPMTVEARTHGPSPEGLHTVTYFMAGFLVSTVWKLHGETIERDRALRIVGDHFRQMR
jgi:hypothetical protein